MGKSGHVAKKITASFQSVGIEAAFLHPSEASHGDMGLLKPTDVVVVFSNSGESYELNDVLNYCDINKIKIIAIVGNKNSTLSRKATVSILVPVNDEGSKIGAPMVSTMLAMAVGDALVAVMIKEKEVDQDIFKKYHPGGSIGASLVRVRDVMHSGEKLPIINTLAGTDELIDEISSKGFGCVAVVDGSGSFVGVITDGDLRRNIANDISSTLLKHIKFAEDCIEIINYFSIDRHDVDYCGCPNCGRFYEAIKFKKKWGIE
jgi:arabinose-5-phosphate isomerase